ncbi:carotenoid biosynthesis protein [Blastococcus sp. VKM Ac-2987]|uniref:carotenoid biosynthesis protein n=1 Tax=Blastococcus sp. VKM Ac-2987 TaxID=3004141 RepID=UPI0022ABBB61|nr:carotenoid biosynthesis protein [Blastococcus sp. VKM Ac-2987]MCZ2857086.1 carotenoid biosynthesis protein [Blastococcus sp. VKM Ac-2987]
MTAATATTPAPALRRVVPLALAGALVATAIAYPLSSGGLRDVVSWAIVLLGSTLSVVHAGLSRGVRTGLGVLALVALVAIGFESVGLATGYPYGSYTYSDTLGPTLLGVPFLVPLAWLMMAWPSWLLGALLARPVRAALRRPARIGWAAAVFAAWDVVLDPQLVQAGYWTWADPSPGLPGIDTVPLTNLAGWLVAGVVLMTLLDLLVARTRAPGAPRVGPAAPLFALAWMTLGGALAHAGWLGLPGSAAWGAGLGACVLAVLALQQRRARRR